MKEEGKDPHYLPQWNSSIVNQTYLLMLGLGRIIWNPICLFHILEEMEHALHAAKLDTMLPNAPNR